MSGYGPMDTGRVGTDSHHVAAVDSGHAETPPAVGGNNSFRLSGPPSVGNLLPSVTLKQGEKKEVTVSIHRGSEFKQNVKLEVKNPPKGLMVTPEKPALMAADKEAKVMIEAAKDAPLGTETVTVTGVPDSGPSADLKLEVKVEKGGASKRVVPAGPRLLPGRGSVSRRAPGLSERRRSGEHTLQQSALPTLAPHRAGPA
jgi:uncharacterized membrane protein